jgi:hypothetical protein
VPTADPPGDTARFGPHALERPGEISGAAPVERFFRAAASLDIDKADLRRYNDFLNRKVQDLMVRAEATAIANDRDVILPADLPITKGLQECMQAFRILDGDVKLRPILEVMVAHPLLDLPYSDTTEERIPDVAGGLSVALARSFRMLQPDLENPESVHWDRAFALFDLLV